MTIAGAPSVPSHRSTRSRNDGVRRHPPWPDRLNDAQVPTPVVGRHGALVDVRTASLNPLDKMAGNGEFKQLKAGLAWLITALYQ